MKIPPMSSNGTVARKSMINQPLKYSTASWIELVTSSPVLFNIVVLKLINISTKKKKSIKYPNILNEIESSIVFSGNATFTGIVNAL